VGHVVTTPSSNGSGGRILVVDDDPDIARFVEINMRLEGFDVRIARDGEEALTTIAEDPPDLVLLDVMMPRIDGVEVCRRLRADPSTAHLAIIMLTAKSLSADKVVGLTAGADDYLIKPFDTLELVARVRSTMRRNAEMRSASPLTNLPGNTRIDDEISARMTAEASFAVCYFDLDNFKAFNDAYGFLRGDDAILALARGLQTAVLEAGKPTPFLGHVGGDDFVVVCDVGQAEELCSRVLSLFDAVAPGLYDAADADRGHIAITDRQGNLRKFPLVSVSAGIASTERRTFADPRQVVAVATEMKNVAKGTTGSAVAVDRRSD
jgi:diguanylate cyclase (GGDEF)-like protein